MKAEKPDGGKPDYAKPDEVIPEVAKKGDKTKIVTKEYIENNSA